MSETVRSRAALAELKKSLDRWFGVPALHLLGFLDALPLPRRARREPSEVRTIVLLKLWGVGNLAMILPLLRPLRLAYPSARLVFVTLERNRALVEADPRVDEVWTLDETGLLRPFRSILALLLRLRRERVDLLLDFEQFLRLPGLLARLGRVHQAIGFDTPGQSRARLHQARVPYDARRHMASVFADVVRACGVEVPRTPTLSVPRDPSGVPEVLRNFVAGSRGPVVLLHPGSGDNFPGRRWPAERFARLGVLLAERWGARLVLSGTGQERELLGELHTAFEARGVPHLDLGGTLSLLPWIEVLAAVDVVVSNDTGPVHLAGAVGTPVVALYGPNTPEIYGPLDPASRAVYHALPCSPCLTNLGGKSSSCRLPACVLTISVDEVLREVQEVLFSRGFPRSPQRDPVAIPPRPRSEESP